MTRAVTIAELGDTNVFSVDGTNNRIGIGSTQPTAKLDVDGDGNVSGTLTATAFVGDGTGLTGVASTDNIITGTAATFSNNVNISGVTTVGVLTAYTSVTVGTAITADAASGIVTATKFVGDGSELTGVSGFATALSSDQTNILNRVFKTPATLVITSDTTVTSDAASDFHAFVREGILDVQDGQVFTVGSGTTFVMNVLGIFP